MEFSRQEYWSGLACPSPGDLPKPGSNPGLLHSRQILYCLSYLGSSIHLSISNIWYLFHGLKLCINIKAFLNRSEISIQFSHSVVSNSLQPHGPQHARPPCPSLTPGVHSNSRPLSQWCHPTFWDKRKRQKQRGSSQYINHIYHSSNNKYIKLNWKNKLLLKKKNRSISLYLEQSHFKWLKTISKKKKCKKAKWLSEEALQIAEKRREAKGKREKERYTIWMQSSKE